MRAVALLGFVLAVAGCTSSPPAACASEPCSPAPSSTSPSLITRPPGVDLPPVPANETLRTLRLENCTGIAAGLNLPPERVDPFVPDDFERFSHVPGTWAVVFSALDCSRAVFAGKLYTNYKEFHVAPKVVLRNTTWDDAHAASFFLLDHYFGDPAIAAAFSALGLPAERAEFEVQATGSLTSWKVMAENVSFAFEYPKSSQPTNPLNLTNFHWQGPGPFIRAKLELAVRGDVLHAAGTIRTEGRSPTTELLQTPVAAWDAGADYQLDLIEVVEPTLYGGNISGTCLALGCAGGPESVDPRALLWGAGLGPEVWVACAQ